MKFIRDIIAEKASTAESAAHPETETAIQRGPEPETENPADPAKHGIRRARRAARQAARVAAEEDLALHLQDGNLDFIKPINPVDQAPDGADQDADAGYCSAEMAVELPGKPDMGFEPGQQSEPFDDEDEFDLLGDPYGELAGDPQAAETRVEEEPDGLFADLWPQPTVTQDPTAQEAQAMRTENMVEPDDAVAEADTIESQVKEALNGLNWDEQPAVNEPPQPIAYVEPAVERPISNPAPIQMTEGVPETSPFQRIMEKHAQAPAGQMPNAQPVSSHPTTPVELAIPVEPAASVEPTTPVEPVASAAPVANPAPQPVAMPAPAAGRVARQAGRVKTRLLGFNPAQSEESDPFKPAQSRETAPNSMYPVGWIVVVSGPGCGNAFTLFNGVSQIGRGEGQAVRLDFGDNSISRSNHAAVAYDGEQQAFYLGHGGKANLVRLDGNPVLSTEPLRSGALIRIGETTLRFVALCSQEFDWDTCQNDESSNAQFH